MTINVTAEDIENGVPRSCLFCPVAQAVAKQTGLRVSVGAMWFFVEAVPHPTPEDVSNFVMKYDAGDKVEPFSFTLPGK